MRSQRGAKFNLLRHREYTTAFLWFKRSTNHTSHSVYLGVHSYLGNTALTNLGDLAGILYPECDPPADMGRAGATAWMAGITQSNIDQTNIYRTKYSPGGLFGKGWCNMLMNTLLEGDNDGVVETVFSTPPSGGNVFPITEGWCHAEGMNHPRKYSSTLRSQRIESHSNSV